MAKKPTISEIARNTKKDAPYFFSKNNLKAFGQKMSSFKVHKAKSGRIYIYAKSYDRDGKFMTFTTQEYIENGINSKLKPLPSKYNIWKINKVEVLKKKFK